MEYCISFESCESSKLLLHLGDRFEVVARMAGGLDAPDIYAPFQCSIQSENEHFCGCSIISSEWILTAAHCSIMSNDTGNFRILVGTNVLSKGEKYYAIEKWINHEKWNQPKLANDIALIRLNETIEFNDRVQPIKLSSEEIPDGTTLELTGWGSTNVSALFCTFVIEYFSKSLKFQ